MIVQRTVTGGESNWDVENHILISKRPEFADSKQRNILIKIRLPILLNPHKHELR